MQITDLLGSSHKKLCIILRYFLSLALSSSHTLHARSADTTRFRSNDRQMWFISRSSSSVLRRRGHTYGSTGFAVCLSVRLFDRLIRTFFCHLNLEIQDALRTRNGQIEQPFGARVWVGLIFQTGYILLFHLPSFDEKYIFLKNKHCVLYHFSIETWIKKGNLLLCLCRANKYPRLKRRCKFRNARKMSHRSIDRCCCQCHFHSLYVRKWSLNVLFCTYEGEACCCFWIAGWQLHGPSMREKYVCRRLFVASLSLSLSNRYIEFFFL